MSLLLLLKPRFHGLAGDASEIIGEFKWKKKQKPQRIEVEQTPISIDDEAEEYFSKPEFKPEERQDSTNLQLFLLNILLINAELDKIEESLKLLEEKKLAEAMFRQQQYLALKAHISQKAIEMKLKEQLFFFLLDDDD